VRGTLKTPNKRKEENFMKTKIGSRILGSIMVVALASLALGAGTLAYFSDIETSTGNTFTAGTLDLKVDGADTNVVKWTVTNFAPGGQQIRVFALKNEGSMTGYLDIENIVVTENENTRIEPEIEGGDTTDAVGELGSVVSINLFIDQNGNGWYDTGDVYIQPNTVIASLPSNYNQNIPIAPGQTIYIASQVNWWSSSSDNLAQSDSLTLDLKFELGQTVGQ